MKVPADDVARIREFYRLSPQIEDELWPGWSKVPDPLLLVTRDAEFLTHWEYAPAEFDESTEGFVSRPRQFDTHFEATLPIFGPPAVILIGEPANTAGKSSTPWTILLMHEHFHQLQDAQPGYFDAVKALGIAHGDETGMWMLNYPFPYTKPEVAKGFAKLRDQLMALLKESNDKKFGALADKYVASRKAFLAQLSADDHKYFSFQLWQEGMARFTQIKAAEAASGYKPTAEYMALADYESFADYAPKLRARTFFELEEVDLAQSQRVAFYSFGAAEGMFLDRFNPGWESEYFKHLLSTDALFDLGGH